MNILLVQDWLVSINIFRHFLTSAPMHISAVMAVYNCDRYIDDAVASIISQSYLDWDLTIVDDGSTDKTGVLISEWAKKEPRIAVFHNAHTGACAIPRNFGLERAQGDLIAVLDGDDVTHPDRFMEVMKLFQENPDTDVVYHDYVRFESKLPTFSESPAQKDTGYLQRALDFGALEHCGSNLFQSTSLFRAFLATTGTGMTPSSVMLRRSALAEVGPRYFRSDLPSFEDVDFFLRLAESQQFLFLDKVLFAYRRTPGSILNSVKPGIHARQIFQVKGPVLIQEEEKLPRKDLKRVREVLSEGWRSMGWSAAYGGLQLIAIKCYLQSLRLTRKPRCELHPI